MCFKKPHEQVENKNYFLSLRIIVEKVTDNMRQQGRNDICHKK